ncbi:hypothetical protein Poli38472_000077 [Pythium oligandrum]|uniref:NADH:flavin oxidoreductase/NADH oxidase N-terminal domain-containing protein n=1 Tax=Pythium oligandrum TaxID=41045 RepID=A0A8K1CC11_PYTOL|nr:hypothetical protein Poli38472_000077 [Pythium oligandrum]|eukprot:TMW60035.1 hypothetical protein Poli38472_000077 [Pythium oligandrum]
MITEKLFTPVTLGGKSDAAIQLQHRISMAPLTRLRADDDGVLPLSAATYYAQRATPGGLLIAEATNISPTGRGYYGSPGIFSQAQIDAWKPVTKAVHDKRGKIFLQLWHTGRMGHSDNQPGNILPVSSTDKRPAEIESKKVTTKDGRVPIGEYRALRAEEIPGICQDYQNAAVNAIAAGFDGVELHAANGYLLEQFLHDGINDRTDAYGGALENRARFLFEALDAIVSKVDSSKVAIRISPFGISFGQSDSQPVTTYNYVLEKLNAYDLAYVHIIEPRAYHAHNPLAPAEGAAHQFRSVYKGVLMTASGYERDSSVQVVQKGDADMVAIGRYFISNPDLVTRFLRNAPLTPWDMSTFYGGGDKGYTDYPTLDE